MLAITGGACAHAIGNGPLIDNVAFVVFLIGSLWIGTWLPLREWRASHRQRAEPMDRPAAMDANYEAPILVIDGSDVSVHRSLDAAVRSVEGVDVEGGLYRCFDAVGRRITLTASGGRRGRITVEIGTVRVESIEAEPTGAGELRDALVDHLQQIGHAAPANASLADVVEMTLRAS
jgi:hypothetical protein